MRAVPFEASDSGCETESIAPLVDEFCQWMFQHRGVMASTLVQYRRVVGGLLQSLGTDPTCYTAVGLREVVRDRAGRHGPGHARAIVSMTRMFVRFLSAQGLCTAGLEGALPTVPVWRLATLPRYVSVGEVTRIVHGCDARTTRGVRDRAVLLLLARLGLRAGDVADLRLTDLDWDDGSLRLAGKGRWEARLPLPQEVGEAVLAYLRRGRPALVEAHVFLAVRPPHGPLSSHAVSDIVARAIRRAGVRAPSHGAHLLRHSLATAMLRQGRSLQEIAAVLRHRSLTTTAHYAKVDVQALRQIAQPWPEGAC